MGADLATTVIGYMVAFFVELVLGGIFGFLGNLLFGGAGDPLA
ncbi:MAG TPA: hypothetical protein P5141_00605 [Candidatus Hydrogenedentes bacterium]|nr:hypothetical protein [Candidatus Hydrogenedentota bacterium]HOC71966.1 hypothetical protein [Candidatus Hydrogenedentota bacterium]HOH49318.1 hypothetical protein [Candidatus Hydrogenedentota bacterium]HQL93236.1 hypothetical protein [Candidatus Hydrogenedentota bacterium]HRZ16033.1 hypothetical protein [Candidatus Hydrogenedentota bacterium]